MEGKEYSDWANFGIRVKNARNGRRYDYRKTCRKNA